MPELPEVENVKLSLEGQGIRGQVFSRVDLLRSDLRTPLKKELSKKLPGQSIQCIERRAKFLLFETEDYLVVNHLGMTGSWRPQSKSEAVPSRKHDHVVVHFKSGLKLIFNDPRRFGLLEMYRKNRPIRWLRHLGSEPLEPEFTGKALFSNTRGSRAPVKSFIMDQKKIVGVGNIYASEALFDAGIKPMRPSGRLSLAECESVVTAIRAVLTKAIAAGGSTIRDFRNSHGESGSFQNHLSVYGRAGENCPRCVLGLLRSRVLAGRNTYWCPKCQR